mgnify:CR=1 FL=1
MSQASTSSHERLVLESLGQKRVGVIGERLDVFYRNTSVWQSNIDIFWSTSHLEKNAAGSWVLSNLSGLSLITVFGVAMVGSLFSADAWNNVTFISGDIQNPKRNLPMALLIGTSIVITLYVLANVAYLNLLPLQGNPNGTTVAQQGIQFATADRVGTAAATMAAWLKN